jgi:hypothetical protein
MNPANTEGRERLSCRHYFPHFSYPSHTWPNFFKHVIKTRECIYFRGCLVSIGPRRTIKHGSGTVVMSSVAACICVEIRCPKSWTLYATRTVAQDRTTRPSPARLMLCAEPACTGPSCTNHHYSCLIFHTNTTNNHVCVIWTWSWTLAYYDDSTLQLQREATARITQLFRARSLCWINLWRRIDPADE